MRNASDERAAAILTSYQPSPDADDGTQRRKVAEVSVLLIRVVDLNFSDLNPPLSGGMVCRVKQVHANLLNLTLVPQLCAAIRI